MNSSQSTTTTPSPLDQEKASNLAAITNMMMTLTRITRIKDLDDIVLMVKALHEQLDDKFFSFSGFMTWLGMNLHQENFRVYKAEDNGQLMGYCVAQIIGKYFEPELEIVDAYMIINESEFVNQVFEELKDWAKEKKCTTVSCISPRSQALEKVYGFEPCGMIMRKSIGD